MKKLLLIVSLLTLTLLPVAATTSAGAVNVFTFCSSTKNAGKTDLCKDQSKGAPKKNPIIKLIATATQIFVIILGIAAVIMIIVSGLQFVTASGDAQKVSGARSTITYALVGLVVAALAQAIVSFVLNKVG